MSLSLILASCDENGLTDGDVLKEDISGKPKYEGLHNDGLEFSLIPLVEGNNWQYLVVESQYNINQDGEAIPLEPTHHNYNLSVTETFEEEGFRWFNLHTDNHIRFEFPFHVFDNGILALSNREHGMLQKSSDGHDNFGNQIVETSLLMPYYENHHGRDVLYNHSATHILVDPDLSYTTVDGRRFDGLIRYRYQLDIGEYYGLPELPDNFVINYDYYFDPEIGLVAFKFGNEILNIASEIIPEIKENLYDFGIHSLVIELQDYELIDL